MNSTEHVFSIKDLENLSGVKAHTGRRGTRADGGARLPHGERNDRACRLPDDRRGD